MLEPEEFVGCLIFKLLLFQIGKDLAFGSGGMAEAGVEKCLASMAETSGARRKRRLRPGSLLLRYLLGIKQYLLRMGRS